MYSIGTNSTRALVADLDLVPPRVVGQWSIGTRLGEGLREHGSLAPLAVTRTLDALAMHRANVEQLTQNVVAIATSAVRRAKNAAQFSRDVADVTGAELHVLDGAEEAECSFLGAVALTVRPAKSYGVLDPGGGSTEYATGNREGPQRSVSCEIGAVRLTEAVPALAGDGGPVEAEDLARARAIAEDRLSALRDHEKVDAGLVVGGTATTLAATSTALGSGDICAELSRGALCEAIALLARLPLEQRRRVPGIPAQRADILLAGAIVIDTALEALDLASLTVSGGDLLLGYLLKTNASTAPDTGHRAQGR